MRQSVLVELDLPRDYRQFSMPSALRDRLQDLLDRQDEKGKLAAGERREAEALAELSEMLTLLKLRAARASGRKTQ
jgi:hypothetical protein